MLVHDALGDQVKEREDIGVGGGGDIRLEVVGRDIRIPCLQDAEDGWFAGPFSDYCLRDFSLFLDSDSTYLRKDAKASAAGQLLKHNGSGKSGVVVRDICVGCALDCTGKGRDKMNREPQDVGDCALPNVSEINRWNILSNPFVVEQTRHGQGQRQKFFEYHGSLLGGCVVVLRRHNRKIQDISLRFFHTPIDA